MDIATSSQQTRSRKSCEQPRHHAPKNRVVSRLRRRRLLQAALTGENLKNVAIETGLSPRTASSQAAQILREPKCQEAFIRTLERSGLSDEFLAAKIRDLVNAQTPIYAQKDGIFTDERTVPAHETQRKTVELACKLRGYLKESTTTDVNVNIMSCVLQAMNEPTGE